MKTDRPVTRREQYLAKAAGITSGSTPPAVTKEEQYLKKIAEKSLPNVTSADEGKPIVVGSDGAFATGPAVGVLASAKPVYGDPVTGDNNYIPFTLNFEPAPGNIYLIDLSEKPTAPDGYEYDGTFTDLMWVVSGSDGTYALQVYSGSETIGTATGGVWSFSLALEATGDGK